MFHFPSIIRILYIIGFYNTSSCSVLHYFIESYKSCYVSKVYNFVSISDKISSFWDVQPNTKN